MGTIREIKEKYERAYNAIPDVVADRVAQTSDVILDLNKDQLLQGRNADGELLSPTYTNDPYFETPDAADRYFRMKRALEGHHRARMRYVELYGEKPIDVPNLIVTGPFQDSMFIRTTRTFYVINSMYQDANEINEKYKGRVFGLAPKTREFYYFGFIRRSILELYKK
jgi:hypothetical protein